MKKLLENILGKLNKIRLFRSLRFRIAILIILVGATCCIVMRFGVLQNYYSRAVQVRTSDVQSQMKILADHLISFNYLTDPSSGIVNAEIEQVANLYDGRVLVIGQNYSVVKDTYGVAAGKLIISEEVIKTFNGESISHYDNDNSYIEITVPITRNIDGKSSIVGVILTSVSTVPINQNWDILSRNSMLFMFSLFVLILSIAFFMPRVMLRPFNRLASAISEVKDGLTDEKIEVNDYIETEHITDAFNQLIERMRVLEESRQEFVSNVSHELKTPLTSVKVLADSLNNQDDVPVEVYKDFMSDIVNEIDRENVIINDLLSLVKMDKKNPNINITQVNVNELIESVFKRLLPIAKNNKVDLIFESVRQVTAELDEIKFSLALSNLIENGIKYNHEEGYVKVSLDADYQSFTITVSDSGIGIPEEDQKSIFERFYRVDKSHSREIGGTGLGLSICKSAILLHKGTITVDSKEDIGTTFTVKVPLIYSSSGRSVVLPVENKEEHLERFVEVPVPELGAESVTEVAQQLLDPQSEKTIDLGEAPVEEENEAHQDVGVAAEDENGDVAEGEEGANEDADTEEAEENENDDDDEDEEENYDEEDEDIDDDDEEDDDDDEDDIEDEDKDEDEIDDEDEEPDEEDEDEEESDSDADTDNVSEE
ncbi:MAG: HAMP domain-containing histidine kinase [Lachnospiraceae bacterium]|nr:HAMP domain-containing histidine kinase [Lachnospiraceae bacterium]